MKKRLRNPKFLNLLHKKEKIMKFDSLWNGYKFPSCDTCKKDCQGHLDYGNLCSNLNYLKDYAEANYEKK